jgi:TRAP-type C4-dicarboxylate transport system permease small subunit
MRSVSRRLEAGPVARSIRVVSIAAAGIAGLMMLVLTVHVISSVVSRAVANQPIAGTVELTGSWWMVSIVFLGLAYALQRDEHIRVTLIYDSLTFGQRRATDVATGTAGAAVMLFCAAIAIDRALHASAIGEAIISTTAIPIWPLRYLVALGCFLLAAEFALFAARAIARRVASQPTGEQS